MYLSSTTRVIRNAAKWWVFAREWYSAPNSITICHSSGAITVVRWLLVFHSTFELRVCLCVWASSVIFSSTSVIPPYTRRLSSRRSSKPQNHQFPPFPPSAAIVISLPSTGPLIWLGWHVPRLYLTLAQINSWTNLWRNLPQMSPHPLFLHHLCISSSSVSPLAVCLFSNCSHISSPVCRNESLLCSPLCSLSFFFSTCLPFSGRLRSTHLIPYLHPPLPL